MDEIDIWPDIVPEIFEGIGRGDMPEPRAFFGYSISGWMSWLIERLRTNAGYESVPVLSLDGAPLHLRHTGWQEKVAAMLPLAGTLPPTRMLLVHRRHRCWYEKELHFAKSWKSLGVALQEVNLRSVRHGDAVSSNALDGMRPVVSAFVAGAQNEVSAGIEVPGAGPGAAMVDMLEASEPPQASAVQALLQRLSYGPINHELRIPLLFLAVCSGDAELALFAARRLAEEDAGFQAAAYAITRVLAAQGQFEAAKAHAAAWVRDHPADHCRFLIAAMEPIRPARWDIGPENVSSPMDGIDFAVGLSAAAL